MTQENKHKQKKDIKRTSPVETEINLKIYKRRVGSVNQTEMLCYNYKGFKSKSKFKPLSDMVLLVGGRCPLCPALNRQRHAVYTSFSGFASDESHPLFSEYELFPSGQRYFTVFLYDVMGLC